MENFEFLQNYVEKTAKETASKLNIDFFKQMGKHLKPGQALIYIDNGVEYKAQNIKGSIEVTETGLQKCVVCGAKISKRKVVFNDTLLKGAIAIFEQAIKTGQQTVFIQDLKISPVVYSRLNYLVRFGLAFKNEGMKRGEYGVPRKRIQQFLKGEWKVAAFYIDDRITDNREMSEERITINEVPKVAKLREQYGDTLTEYIWNEDFE